MLRGLGIMSTVFTEAYKCRSCLRCLQTVLKNQGSLVKLACKLSQVTVYDASAAAALMIDTARVEVFKSICRCTSSKH